MQAPEATQLRVPRDHCVPSPGVQPGGCTGESGPIPESCRHTATQRRRPASGEQRPPPPLLTEVRGPRHLPDQLLVSDPGALLPDPRLQTTLGTRRVKAQARTPVFARTEEQTLLEQPQSKDQWVQDRSHNLHGLHSGPEGRTGAPPQQCRAPPGTPLSRTPLSQPEHHHEH